MLLDYLKKIFRQIFGNKSVGLETIERACSYSTSLIYPQYSIELIEKIYFKFVKFYLFHKKHYGSKYFSENINNIIKTSRKYDSDHIFVEKCTITINNFHIKSEKIEIDAHCKAKLRIEINNKNFFNSIEHNCIFIVSHNGVILYRVYDLA